MPHKLWRLIFSFVLMAGLFFGPAQPVGARPSTSLRAALLSNSRGTKDVAASQPTPFQPLVSPAIHSDLSPALSAIKPLPPESAVSSEVPNFPLPKVSPKTKDGQALALPSSGDAALQSSQPGPVQMPSPSANFEGNPNLNGVLPPDTNGDIGFDPGSNKKYYVQWVNLSFQIWNVTNLAAPLSVYGPVNGKTLWSGFGGPCQTTNDGDPIVLFDEQAHRWLLSQFALPNFPSGPYYQCIAISQSANPTGAWYRYAFQASATKMNDYPHFGVWPDPTYNAYFMTANQFTNGSSWGGAGVFAFERAKMLTGDPTAAMIYFDLFGVNANFGGMLPADLDGAPPAPGTPGYFFEVDDSASIGPNDAMRLWEFRPNWANPGSSTFGLFGDPNSVLPVANFDLLPCAVAQSRNCIPQPSTSQRLDSIGDRLMHRVAFRNFGGYQAVVLNHTVWADGADRAGIRWYEVRKTGSAWSIQQQGTYAPADGQYRWLGSLAMDTTGDIALGYSVSSNTTYPSIRYAGRLSGDPLNTLPQAETSLMAGGGSQTHVEARWGDYSMLGVDPQDACTFWYTNEYLPTTSVAGWQTRIGAFKFPGCTLGPTGALTGAVTDVSNGAPLVGAQITASSSPTQTIGGSSGVGGTYSMTLPVATYTVTASAYGYNPDIASGVSIISGTTTARDFALTPSPSYVVSGTVRDAAAGWPLYAQINIAGWPGGALWNDPVTGFYSVTLAASIIYTFSVNAWVVGYTELTRTVAPLTGNRTENFGLNADLAACTAPGYQLPSPIFSESFSSGTLPAGWSNIDNAGSGQTWQFDDPGSRGNLTGGGGPFAILDSDHYGLSFQDAELRTPSVNLSTAPNVRLEFDMDYRNFGDTADVDVSGNGGTSWTNVWEEMSDARGPRHEVIDISAVAGGKSNVKVRFHYYNAFFAYWWEVDNVQIRRNTCTLQAGGLVVGQVYDANTNATLAGAKVANDSGLSTTTAVTSDPAVDDAFYTLYSPAGPHVLTGTLNYFGADIQTPTVVLSNTVQQDFHLPAGRLSLTPPVLAITLTLGLSATVPLTLTNSGGLSVPITMIEIEGGYFPALIGPYNPAAGHGVWLDRSEDGVLLPANTGKGGTRLAYPGAFRWTPYQPSAPLNILLYADDLVHSSPTTFLDQALQRLSLAYTAHYDGDWTGFESDLTGGAWDLVLVGDDNFSPPASTLTALDNYVHNGGKLIFHSWVVSTDPGRALWNTLGFTWIGDDADPPAPIYWWQPNHLIFNVPDGVPQFTSVTGGIYFTYGERVEPLAGFQALAGYSTPGPNQNQAALIVGNQGRTVFKGFLDGQNSADLDGDATLDGVELWTNLIFGIQQNFSADVPWLSETPVSGTVNSLSNLRIDVTFDASLVDQPGQYLAQLKVKDNTPYTLANIPITLTVTAGHLLFLPLVIK